MKQPLVIRKAIFINVVICATKIEDCVCLFTAHCCWCLPSFCLVVYILNSFCRYLFSFTVITWANDLVCLHNVDKTEPKKLKGHTYITHLIVKKKFFTILYLLSLTSEKLNWHRIMRKVPMWRIVLWSCQLSSVRWCSIEVWGVIHWF